MTTLGRGLLIDFVRGQKLRRPEVRRLDLFHELEAHGAKRVAALGDFDEVDVGVEVVERDEFLGAEIGGRIHPQQVDGIRPLTRPGGLGDLAVQNGPNLSSPGNSILGRISFGLGPRPHSRSETAADEIPEPPPPIVHSASRHREKVGPRSQTSGPRWDPRERRYEGPIHPRT